MRLITKTLTLVIIASLLCLPLGVFKPARAAGTATMYLTPASGSAVKGGTITADVHVDSGTTTIYSVYVALAYPTSSLTWLSFTPTSAFSIVPKNQAVGGVAQLDANTLSGVSGDNVVATVKFSVVAGSGTANLAFNPVNTANPLDPNASSVKTATPGQPTYTEILGSTTGSSYSLSGDPSPPPPPPPSPTTTPPTPTPTASGTTKPSAPKSSGSSSPSPSPAAPASLGISNISVSGLGPSSATITWQTSVEADSIVDYGLSNSYIAIATDRALVKDHKVSLNPLTLLADTTYHFRVRSTDVNNNSVQSADITFHTPLKSPVASKAKKTDTKQLITAGAIVLIALLGLVIASKRYSKLQADRREMDLHFPKLPTAAKAAGSSTSTSPPANNAINASGSAGAVIKPAAATQPDEPVKPAHVPAKPKIPAKFQAKPLPAPSAVIKPAEHQGPKPTPITSKVAAKPAVAKAEIKPVAKSKPAAELAEELKRLKQEVKNVKKG